MPNDDRVGRAGPRRIESEADIDQYQWECLAIEPLVLTEEYVRLPSDVAYWNERYASVYKHWLEMKARRERVLAERSEELRKTLKFKKQADVADSSGRVTIAEVESAVARDPAYQAARDKEIAAEAEKVRLFGVLDALRTKRDMLVSLGAHMRAEMSSGISTRDPGFEQQGGSSDGK